MKDWNSGKFTPCAKGDKVWLEAHNLKCLYENHKFAPKREGPFSISKVLSPIMYYLSIPSKWKIHNIFHTFLLSPYHKNDVCSPNYMRPSPDLIGTEEEYEVEANLEHVGDLLSAYKKAHPKAFPSRTWTITISHIYSEMSPTRTVPHTQCFRNPACPGTLNTHCLILDNSHFASPLFMAVKTDSPLYLTYQAAFQAFWVENLGCYVDGCHDRDLLQLSPTHSRDLSTIPKPTSSIPKPHSHSWLRTPIPNHAWLLPTRSLVPTSR